MRSHRPFLRTVAALTLIPAVGLVACSDSEDATGPEGNGTVSGFVSDGSSPSPYYEGGSSFEGTFQGTASLEVYSEAEGWVSLGSPASVQFQLQSSEQAPCGSSTQVPAGTYSRVRLTLTGAEAQLGVGAAIGGLVLTSAVNLSLGASGDVVIEKEITPVEIRAESQTEVRFDLNAEAWVTEESVAAESASEASVSSATTVTVS